MALPGGRPDGQAGLRPVTAPLPVLGAELMGTRPTVSGTHAAGQAWRSGRAWTVTKGVRYVHVIGLAEDVIPSFQSRQKGDTSPEMEEERQNCFVAIARAKEGLVLSRAECCRDRPKGPSRFLVEMGFVV